MTTKTKKEQPTQRIRHGRFSLSVWANHRACLQYSRKDWQTGEWQNQHVWCEVQELRDLTQLLDKYDKAVRGEEDNDSSSSLPLPRYLLLKRIMDYIRIRNDYLENMTLDWADLQEFPIHQILHDLGIDTPLTPEELNILSKEIESIAESNQTREIVSSLNL